MRPPHPTSTLPSSTFDKTTGTLTFRGDSHPFPHFFDKQQTKTIIIAPGVTRIESVSQDIGIFEGCSSLTKVIFVENSCTSIGKRAFKSCSLLASIELPPNCSFLGQECFASSGLKTLAIPASCNRISNAAFSYCSSLSSVILNSNTCTLGYSLFENCVALREFNLPSTLTVIPQEMFWNCSSLIAMDLHFGIKEIGIQSFSNCSGIRRMVIPLSVKRICDGALRGMEALVGLEISDSCVWVGEGVFEDCVALRGGLYVDVDVEGCCRNRWRYARLLEFKVNLFACYRNIDTEKALDVLWDDPLIDKSAILWRLYSGVESDDVKRKIVEYLGYEWMGFRLG